MTTCGGCRHWRAAPNGNETGSCHAVLPMWVEDIYGTTSHRSAEDCDAFDAGAAADPRGATPLRVKGCADCPFCEHEEPAGHSCRLFTVADGWLDVSEAWFARTKPEACPLRHGPVVVELEEGER